MLPKSWDDITLRKFIEICNITNTVKDTIEQEIHILSSLHNTTYEEIEKYTISKLTKEAASIAWMANLPTKKKLKTQFRYKGKVYKTCLVFSDMTAGQFIDFSTICKDVKPEEMINHAADLIGAMVQQREYSMTYPFIKYEYKGYHNTDFLDMPMSQAYPYYVFFCKVSTNLYPAMLNYSKKTAQKELKKAKKLLKKDL